MSAYFIPRIWPESEAQEEELDAQVEASFPSDDKFAAFFVGDSAPNPVHVRVRMCRELAGWIAFENIVTDFLAGAVLLVAVGLIASFQIRTIFLLVLAFVAMQLINGVRFAQAQGVAQRLADLLPAAQEYEKPTLTMFICVLERIATTFYRVRARTLIAVLMSAAGLIILATQRSWLFALISFLVVLFTTVLLVVANMRRLREKLVAVPYQPSGRPDEELGAAIEAALDGLDGRLGNWYSRISRRPRSGAPLHLPRRRLVWLSAFDMEFCALVTLLAGLAVYRFRDLSLLGFQPLKDGLPGQPLLVVSGLLGLTILAISRLSDYERGTYFSSVLLRRFSLESDLLTRRVTGPILAACGRAQVVVPQSLAVADESPGGAVISRGLRRSWSEKLIDAHIQAGRQPPTGVGVFAVPRGAFARAGTVTFSDAEWRQGVTELLRVADAAVIDVTDVSDSVRFEVATALEALPRDRVVFLCRKGELGRFGEMLQQQGGRISDLPHVVQYRPGYAGRISLRWRLGRLVRAFR